MISYDFIFLLKIFSVSSVCGFFIGMGIFIIFYVIKKMFSILGIDKL